MENRRDLVSDEDEHRKLSGIVIVPIDRYRAHIRFQIVVTCLVSCCVDKMIVIVDTVIKMAGTIAVES